MRKLSGIFSWVYGVCSKNNLAFCLRCANSSCVLKQDPNTYNVQKNVYLLGHKRTICYFLNSIPGEIKRREVELGCESWTCFASACSSTAVQRTLSLWLCPPRQFTAITQCTSRCVTARGHRLNTSIILAAVHGLSGLFRAVSVIEPSLFRPPTCPRP